MLATAFTCVASLWSGIQPTLGLWYASQTVKTLLARGVLFHRCVRFCRNRIVWAPCVNILTSLSYATPLPCHDSLYLRPVSITSRSDLKVPFFCHGWHGFDPKFARYCLPHFWRFVLGKNSIWRLASSSWIIVALELVHVLPRNSCTDNAQVGRCLSRVHSIQLY